MTQDNMMPLEISKEDYNQLYTAIESHLEKNVHHTALKEELVQCTLQQLRESYRHEKNVAQLIARGKKIAQQYATTYFTVRHGLLLDEFHINSSILDLLTHNEVELLPGDYEKQGELLEYLHNRIRELPEKLRKPLLLRYFDRMTLLEIGETVKASIETVENRLKKARKTVLKAAKAYEHTNGIQLNYVGVVPLLLWMSLQYRLCANVPCTQGAIAARYFGEMPRTKKEKGNMTGMKIVIGILVAAVVICGILFLPKLFTDAPAQPGTTGDQTTETGAAGNQTTDGNVQNTETQGTAGQEAETTSDTTESGETAPETTTQPDETTQPTESKPTETEPEETTRPPEGPTTPIIPL